MKFDSLLQLIQSTSSTLQQNAVKAINRMLTIRNWLIRYYIVEYEQNGEDRAIYGERLLDRLAESLDNEGLSGRNLKLFRQFYLVYPQIGETLPALLNSDSPIVQPVIAQLDSLENQESIDWRPLTAKSGNAQVLLINPEKLIQNLSFSHIIELLAVEDSPKRMFYEIECMKGTWSVRELRRQIN